MIGFIAQKDINIYFWDLLHLLVVVVVILLLITVAFNNISNNIVVRGKSLNFGEKEIKISWLCIYQSLLLRTLLKCSSLNLKPNTLRGNWCLPLLVL